MDSAGEEKLHFDTLGHGFKQVATLNEALSVRNERLYSQQTPFRVGHEQHSTTSCVAGAWQWQWQWHGRPPAHGLPVCPGLPGLAASEQPHLHRALAGTVMRASRYCKP